MSSPLVNVAELLDSTDPPVNWLVPNFIPAGSLIALAGEPGAGKSFFAYTLSLALATGTDWLGWEIEPHRVLYFDQENSRPDMTQYMRWAWQGLRRPDLEMIEQNLHFASFLIGGPDWAARAMQLVQITNPELIIIDTTTPACNIQDENDNAEATRAITQLRRLMAACNPVAGLIALKHAKVRPDDGGYTLRGAKAWEGAVDSVIYQVKLPGRPAKGEGLRSTKLEPSKTRAFGLRETVKIRPRWIESRSGERIGIGLDRQAVEAEPERVEQVEEPREEPANDEPAESPATPVIPGRRSRWRVAK